MNEGTVQPVSRRVIEHKLLTALEDSGTVAILASETDLKVILAGLLCLTVSASPHHKHATEYIQDLQRLKDAAFPGSQ